MRLPMRTETKMNRRFGALVITVFGSVMALFVGCAGIRPYEPPPQIEVSLTSFSPVAGKWAGFLKTEPRLKKADWVKVKIEEDGSYSFANYRDIEVLQGKGTFTLAHGLLMEVSDRGRITGRLYDQGSKQRLKFEATGPDGAQYEAELTREKTQEK